MKMLSFFIALLLRGKQENVSTNRRKTWPNIMTLSFRSSASARDFVNFYREIKAGSNTIESIDVEKIKKFSKVRSQSEWDDVQRFKLLFDFVKFSIFQLFEDDITLDNMTRGQLAGLCRLLELPVVGSKNILAFSIEMRLRHLKADDQVWSINLFTQG